MASITFTDVRKVNWRISGILTWLRRLLGNCGGRVGKLEFTDHEWLTTVMWGIDFTCKLYCFLMQKKSIYDELEGYFADMFV